MPKGCGCVGSGVLTAALPHFSGKPSARIAYKQRLLTRKLFRIYDISMHIGKLVGFEVKFLYRLLFSDVLGHERKLNIFAVFPHTTRSMPIKIEIF